MGLHFEVGIWKAVFVKISCGYFSFLGRASCLVGLVVLNLGLSSAVFGEGSEDRESAAKARAAYIRSHYSKFEVRIPMRDGKKLFTAIYAPNDIHRGKKYPIVFVRTPYSVNPYGEDNYPGVLGITAEFEREGFIFAMQDVRGRWMSEGEFDNMRPVDLANAVPSRDVGFDESTDAFDSIDWMVKHVAGNSGRVGMRGTSYPGFYAACGAINSHPALKASSPQAPIADWWMGDDMHRNGAFNLQLAFTFLGHFGRPRPVPTRDYLKPMQWPTSDAYEYFMELGPLKNGAARYGFDNAHWQTMMSHPNYDEFWKSRNLLPKIRNVKCSTMVVGGWFDTEDLYGPLHIYQELRKHASVKPLLVMGPWSHGGWGGEGSALGDLDFGFKTGEAYWDAELAYFKSQLKDGPASSLPGAWVFETGVNRWRSFDSWPPVAKSRSLFFGSRGGLLSSPASGVEAYDEFLSDPEKPVPYTIDNDQMKHSKNYMTQDQRYAARRPDVLVYTGAELQEPLTVAGPIEVELFVSTDQSDCDWVVKLIDVNPGKTSSGKAAHQQTLVRGEPFRGRFREGGETPKAFVPGQVTKVAYRLNDVFHTFQPGHRVMIQVHSSWFPFIDRNPQKFVPNINEASASDFVKARHRVYVSGAHSSRVVLPILDR